ncbi:hypothetical protein EDB81DRAFT_919617, partial [Dactylonectria macrodidyma]
MTPIQSNSSVSESKRRRSARACLACRKRKVRCDVTQDDSCTNCRLDGFTCEIAPRERRQKTDTMRTRYAGMTSLDQRNSNPKNEVTETVFGASFSQDNTWATIFLRAIRPLEEEFQLLLKRTNPDLQSFDCSVEATYPQLLTQKPTIFDSLCSDPSLDQGPDLPPYLEGVELARVYPGSTDAEIFTDFTDQLLHCCGKVGPVGGLGADTVKDRQNLDDSWDGGSSSRTVLPGSPLADSCSALSGVLVVPGRARTPSVSLA